jgi:hypothetical protein
MALNYSTLVYEHCHEMFGRPIIVTPLVSQPAVSSYTNAGIFDTDELNVLAMDGSVISEQRTELFILENAFTVLPEQGDLVEIPAVDDIRGEGIFEIVDASTNGGGETKLTIRKSKPPLPLGS